MKKMQSVPTDPQQVKVVSDRSDTESAPPSHSREGTRRQKKNARNHDTPAEVSRRSFLGGATTVAVAASTGILSLASPETAGAIEIEPDPPAERAQDASEIRITAANNELNLGGFPHQTNGDEELYADKRGAFSKTLPHNDLGEVDPTAFQQLLQALQAPGSRGLGDFNAFQNLPNDPNADPNHALTLLNPVGGLSTNMEGPDSPAIPGFVVPPTFTSPEMAALGAELYWEAVLRDLPFANYAGNSLVQEAINDLNGYGSAFKGPSPVTADNLFRYDYHGAFDPIAERFTDSALDGPMVSQFLIHSFNYDGIPHDLPKMQTRLPVNPTDGGFDFLSNYDEWLARQRGIPAPAGTAFEATNDRTLRFPRDTRDLGQLAQSDTIFSVYFRAMLILNGFGANALNDGNPYKNNKRQSGFATLGGGDLARLVGSAHKAERHAWYQKWNVHRFLRPEVFAGRVHNQKIGAKNYGIDPRLINSPVLDHISAINADLNERRFGNINDAPFLLPQMAVNGSPTHPSSPAGHAITAGACVTVLKAWFNESFVFPNPQVVSADGTTLSPWMGIPLTIGAELNKLVQNISEGRDMSGVHWRTSDNLLGNLMGEEVAVRLLRESKATYPEDFTFTFHGFLGNQIVI